MSKFSIITLLESVLGRGKINSNDNVAFHCPFCHHNKKKMEINIVSQYWHCWVCNAAGRKLAVLFRKLNVQREKISKLVKLLDDVEYKPTKTTTDTPVLQLPDGFTPLWKLDKVSPEYKNAIYYLQKRGITIFDIIRYRIGYAEKGPYSGKIIIPSYDCEGQLNYFVSRAFYENDPYKHKNPKISKDIIGFDMLINWNEPIILCEGAFDAITIKRNAIPLFGKMINPKLRIKIIEEGVQEIYICLDQDALTNAKHIAQTFLREGIKVHLVKLDSEDPNELGYKKITEKIQDTYQFSFEELMQMEIDSLWK